MLEKVTCKKDYRRAQARMAPALSKSDRERLNRDPRLKAARDKMLFLRVDRAEEALLPLYSPDRGRPAWDPAVLVRSFLLMQHFGHTSVQRWHDALAADVLLRYLVGSEEVPSVGAHYGFINRLTGDDPHGELHPEGLFTKRLKELRREYKLKKGEKMVNFDDGDTRKLTERYWDDAGCDAGRWSLPLERTLDLVAVRPSLEAYASHAEGGLTLCGDGSSLHIHASRFGRRAAGADAGGDGGGDVAAGGGADIGDDGARPADATGDAGAGGDGAGAGAEDLPLTHRYTAPDADIGWDSHEEVYFLGFTFYNISWHIGELGLDLPMFVAQRTASQHDALTCVSAVAHMLDVDPALRPAFFCHDSAADAAPIFRWLRHRQIIPIIDWNQRQSSKDPDERRPVAKGIKGDDGKSLEYINERGVPVCACGHEMVRDGYDRSKQATKFRCPCAVGRVKECPMWGVCTKSKYGRVIKIYDKTDYKLHGPIPYRSDRWKEIYKDRTSTERVNNRVLNDYGVQRLTCRNGAKHFFFEVMAAINVHLDAWVKTETAAGA